MGQALKQVQLYISTLGNKKQNKFNDNVLPIHQFQEGLIRKSVHRQELCKVMLELGFLAKFIRINNRGVLEWSLV